MFIRGWNSFKSNNLKLIRKRLFGQVGKILGKSPKSSTKQVQIDIKKTAGKIPDSLLYLMM